MSHLVGKLPEGPLDLIGDVHGEIEGLLALLHRLGCDPERRRSARPIVFLGDLVDRGPDSPAVVELVMHLIEAGLARMVLGNHELNLMRGEKKPGNGWFTGDASDGFFLEDAVGGVRFVHYQARPAMPSERERFHRFFTEQPLALARADLRVVHACWHEDAFAKLPAAGNVGALASEFERSLRADLAARGVRQAAATERAAWDNLIRPDRKPAKMLANVAEEDETEQMHNPVKVLTSGMERRVPYERCFFAGGKWRFVERVPWWWEYQEEPAVIVGHYWRRRDPKDTSDDGLFFGVRPRSWHGARGNVFCVDYSVGLRHLERARGRSRHFVNALGALRWPERELVFDDRNAGIKTTRHGREGEAGPNHA